MSQRNHEGPDADEPKTDFAPAAGHEVDGLAGFPGPGYTGFAGGVGYHGSGFGGATGGYAGVGGEDTSWQPPPETRHDDRIHEDVLARLRMSPDIDASDIEVSVEAGVVTLHGNVDTRHMKSVAGDIAESVPDVVSVKNRLHSEQGLLDELREKLSPPRDSQAR